MPKEKSQSRKKILFVLPSLSAGGAERVMSFIAMRLNHRLFDVKLIVLGFQKENVYDVSSIKVVYLNKKRLLSAFAILFKTLLKEKPAVVVSSISHVNIAMGIFSVFLPKIKFIGREASVVSTMTGYTNLNPKFYFLLLRVFYNKLSAIICQSEDMRKDFAEALKINPKKLVVINNPITDERPVIKRKKPSEKISFITVGRLSKEKGHLRIIEGLSKIDSYDFCYTILGSGPQEKAIQAAVDSYDLSKKVNFIPYSSKVSEELSKYDYFIQGSYVEGFPNALLESCVVGTPVIAFNAPGGTREIIVDGVNGYLIENEVEFDNTLSKLSKFTTINSANVRNSVFEKFNAETILEKYEMLFQRL